MSYLQGIGLLALGYATCYVKENKEYVLSKLIDLYVDGIRLGARLLQCQVEPPFWDSLKTVHVNQQYLTTYTKDNHYYKVLHNDPKPELSTAKRLSELDVVIIESETELTREENHLVKLILSQWAGYSGDFHGNDIKLYQITALSNLVLTKKITKIVVNTNIITETVIT